MTWLLIPAIVALVAFSLFRAFSADRIEALTARLRGSSRLVSRGEFIQGKRHLDVAMALTDSSLIYESSSMQGSLDRNWIQEVGYENRLSTGKSVGDAMVLRLRCLGRTFEFVLARDVVGDWESFLPSHGIKVKA
jgi:hypothetical protein